MEEGIPQHEEIELLRAERFNDNQMSLKEFVEEYEYCKGYNTPEGEGCSNCKGNKREYCADELIHAGEWVNLQFLNLR